MIINLIVIWRVCLNRDNERFRLKYKYVVLEKWIFENLRGSQTKNKKLFFAIPESHPTACGLKYESQREIFWSQTDSEVILFRKTPSPSFEEKFQQKMALRRETTRRKVTEMKSKTTISHGFSKIKKHLVRKDYILTSYKRENFNHKRESERN